MDAINAVNDAQRAGANAVMGEQAAYDQWIASLQEASAQVEKNGKSLDSNTEAGRSNREYLRGLATDARDYTDAMRDNGASVDVLNAKMGEQRSAFIETAAKFGVTGAAAEALADSYGLIPNYVETAVATPGAKLSKQEADDLNAALQDIPPELRPEIVTIGHTEGAEAAKRAIDAVQSKTVYINVQRAGLQSSVWGDDYATGGRIIGPGTGTSDDVPIMASNGEFMVRTWAAQKIGYARMAYINRTGEIPRFADGGVIGQYATTGALSRPGDSYASVNTVTNYHFEGREALGWLVDHLRDGQRRSYQTGGVHG